MKLTPRQIEVIDLVAHGYRNKQVALKLGITHHTVRNMTIEICQRLGASTLENAIFLLYGGGNDCRIVKDIFTMLNNCPHYNPDTCRRT